MPGFGVFVADPDDEPVLESVSVAAFSENVSTAAGIPEDEPVEGVPGT